MVKSLDWLRIAYLAFCTSACVAYSSDERPWLRLPSTPVLEVETELMVEATRAVGAVSASRSLLSIRASSDLAAWDTPGVEGQLVFDIRANRGESAVLEAAQGTSTLDAPDASQLSEVFYQNQFLDGSLRWRVGILDGNSEFAAISGTDNLLNPAPATSPSILGIPTWPFTAPGSEVVVDAWAPLSVGLGAYDTSFVQSFDELGVVEPPTSGGEFLIGELRIASAVDEPRVRGVFGSWYESSEFESESGDAAAGRSGSYAAVEVVLLDNDLDGVIRAFGFVGGSESVGVDVDAHLAVGMEWEGASTRRPADVFGVAWSRVDLGSFSRADSAETVSEAFYRAEISDSVAVTVSAQFVDNPAGADGESELVLGVRGSLSL